MSETTNGVLLMEETKKYIISDEALVEMFCEAQKEKIEEAGGILIDKKITLKETSDSTYFIVTLKSRFLTLPQAKEALGV
jgi:hypothetical protein